MYNFTKVIGNILIILGILAFVVGFIVMLGLGSLFSAIISPGKVAIVPIVSIFTLTAGSPILLGSFLVMGFGSLIIHVAEIAEKME